MSGGDINDAYLIEIDQGQRYFLKTNSSPQALSMFQSEVKGLRALSNTNTIAIPEVVDYGEVGGEAYLILPFINQTSPTKTMWERFGEALAELHRSGHGAFGLDHDNFIGRLTQSNKHLSNWGAFYRDHRIRPQIELMKQNLPGESAFFQKAEKFLKRIPQLVETAETSLIHGDLWIGNYISGAGHQFWLIDPAVSVASREMDFAMMNLFGGFPNALFEAYDAVYPRLHGWRDRMPLYQAYYLLVHVNLFGRGYISQTESCISRYV